MHTRTSLLSALIVTALILHNNAYNEPPFHFFPMVQQASLGNANDTLTLHNPCSLLFRLQQDLQHIQQLLEHYQLKTFRCHSAHIAIPEIVQTHPLTSPSYVVRVNIKAPQLKSAFTKEDEKYQLNITKEEATIDASTYVGFVRALETFYQTLDCSESGKSSCEFKHLPIRVTDFPEFEYRGLLIDTAHHYLPLQLILETIDAMMYNKMNVLHWHISDDDSFPLLLQSHPELANRGAFSDQQIYTTQDVKKVVQYALVRGVRVIPEIPTPSHAFSWAKGFDSALGCKATQSQSGAFNTQSDKMLQLVKEVFSEVFQLFPDPIIHLGGKPLSPECLRQQDAFNDNISKSLQSVVQKDVQDANIRYRRVQRQALRGLNASKTFMYWQDSSLQGIESGDIVHWTGSGLPNTSNKIVVTRAMTHHLDLGVGAPTGLNKTSYIVWTQLYGSSLAMQLQKKHMDNVIGSSLALWSETSNEYTHHVKIWMRASTLAERLWNSKIVNFRTSALGRITRHQRIMDKRGIPSAPITCEQCEFNPSFC